MTDASTCWTMIREAAAGDARRRAEFVRTYSPVVQRMLRARWGGGLLAGAVDDAAQEVFVDCFRGGGVLERADPSRPGGFHAYFRGVVRTVALRWERDRARLREVQPDSAHGLDAASADDDGLSTQFDRAWALSILGHALDLQRRRADEAGDEARRRVDLLRLRFEEDLPIREIARRWDADPARVHKEYAKARDEFRAALLDTVAFHHPGSPGEVEREAMRLLSLVR